MSATTTLPSPKIILVGDSGVGSKTTVFRRYCHNEEHDGGSTIGANFAMKQTVVGGVPVKLQIWGLFLDINSSFFQSLLLTVFVCVFLCNRHCWTRAF